LSLEIPDLAAHWIAESRETLLSTAPRSDSDHGLLPFDASVATDLVTALLSPFAADEESGTAIAAGLRFGMECFAKGMSLHHTEKSVGRLVAMVMQAMETATAGSDVPRGDVADGIRLARQLQSCTTLLSLSVIRGHTQARDDFLRDRFRHLRHDLRNPLGTIKSVLALMDDESIPIEARANPNFRDIAKRNARSLEEMIADQLGDTAVAPSGFGNHDVSMQTLASVVCRDLGGMATRRGITILIEPGESRARIDAPALELLLRATLQAALPELHAGERIHLACDVTKEGRAEIRLSSGSDHAPIERRSVRERLTALARKIGASITFSDAVLMSVPTRVNDRGSHQLSERSILREPTGLSVRETPHNLRSTREDDHGQASVL
jgi:signal transduction histidine kinase